MKRLMQMTLLALFLSLTPGWARAESGACLGKVAQAAEDKIKDDATLLFNQVVTVHLFSVRLTKGNLIEVGGRAVAHDTKFGVEGSRLVNDRILVEIAENTCEVPS